MSKFFSKRWTAPLVVLIVASFVASPDSRVVASDPLDLGARRELFLDDYLVASMENVELLTHRPERKELVMVFDKEWEGEGQNYFAALYDGQKYRLYYHAWGQANNHPLTIACIESDDGVNWTHPEYGICEFNGSTANNVVVKEVKPGVSAHDFSPFLDQKPGTPDDEKFKALGFGYDLNDPSRNGLYAWKSPDAVHWTLIQEEPAYTQGKFDTQNISFWSVAENRYVPYYRDFNGPTRVIKRAVSDDYLHWTDQGEIQYPNGDGPIERAQFYTNQVAPYYRAPHLYVGFPTRYVDNGMTASTPLLPEWEERQERIKAFEQRLGTAVTDAVFMSSRDGVNFTLSNDVFVAPGLRTAHNWFYGDNYLSWNVMETNSVDDDSPKELSIYATESYQTQGDSRLRRYTLRIDGFGSIHAKSREGVAQTKPLIFAGKELSLNVATSAAGYVRVEVLLEDGSVAPGFSAEDCDLIYGDSLDRRVSWKGSKDMSSLAGRAISLRFVMKEADIYSLKWEE